MGAGVWGLRGFELRRCIRSLFSRGRNNSEYVLDIACNSFFVLLHECIGAPP